MALNTYFKSQQTGITSEQDVLHGLVAESIQINGVDISYIPRTLVAEDKLFHEDPEAAFNEHFIIEAYIESVDGFGGDKELLTKFGLSVNDEIELAFSVRRFKEVTGMAHPVEGDLIFFKESNQLFEIKYMEDEDPFYQLGTLPTFKITCETFQWSHEDFDTGIVELDTIIDGNSEAVFDDSTKIELEADGVLDFTEQNPWGSF